MVLRAEAVEILFDTPASGYRIVVVERDDVIDLAPSGVDGASREAAVPVAKAGQPGHCTARPVCHSSGRGLRVRSVSGGVDAGGETRVFAKPRGEVVEQQTVTYDGYRPAHGKADVPQWRRRRVPDRTEERTGLMPASSGAGDITAGLLKTAPSKTIFPVLLFEVVQIVGIVEFVVTDGVGGRRCLYPLASGVHLQDGVSVEPAGEVDVLR